MISAWQMCAPQCSVTLSSSLTVHCSFKFLHNSTCDYQNSYVKLFVIVINLVHIGSKQRQTNRQTDRQTDR